MQFSTCDRLQGEDGHAKRAIEASLEEEAAKLAEDKRCELAVKKYLAIDLQSLEGASTSEQRMPCCPIDAQGAGSTPKVLPMDNDGDWGSDF